MSLLAARAGRVAAAATAVAIGAAVAGAGDLTLRVKEAWEREATFNEQQIGLDILLCMRGTCGWDATPEDAARVAETLRSSSDVDVAEVPENELRRSLADLLEESDLQRLRTPPVLRVVGARTDLEQVVRDAVGEDRAVARIQPRNVAARETAALLRDAHRTLMTLSLMQAAAAAAALAALTRARMLTRADDIRLLNLSGVPSRRIRRPHIVHAAAIGACAGLLGSFAAEQAVGRGLLLGSMPGVLDVSATGAGAGALRSAAAMAAAGAVVARLAARHDVRDIPL